MREPDFWYRPPSFTSLLLGPLAALYGIVAGRRMQRAGFSAGVPVFCVGSYHLGGAGKTPTVLALAGLLRELGEKPIVLSRGYGGRLRGPVMVDAERHQATEVGDEPLMLARAVPVVVARERISGVALAKSQNASVILMDDGFHNPAITKDASLVVIDSHRAVGNGKVFPAGPLRAPLLAQMARTDALTVVGDGAAAAPFAAQLAAQGVPLLAARLKPDEASVAALRGKRVLAFAGIGDPERFFKTLAIAGIEVAATEAFPDHYPFSESEIAGLVAKAKSEGLTPVTTEKDMVRLPNAKQSKAILTLAVTLEFDNPAQLRKLLGDWLFNARSRKLHADR